LDNPLGQEGETVERSSQRKMWKAAVAALWLVACGGAPADTSMPVDQARALNSDTTATFVRTQSLLESATALARGAGTLPEGLTADDFDVAMVRQVLEACFTETVALAEGQSREGVPDPAVAAVGPEIRPLTERPPVGRMQPCRPARMQVLESYASTALPEVKEYVMQRVLDMDALRVNLNDVLVQQLEALENVATRARMDADRLRLTAEERRALAQSSTDEATRTQAESDFDAVTASLDQVMAVVEQIEAGITDMRQLRRQLIEEAARNLAQLGE